MPQDPETVSVIPFDEWEADRLHEECGVFGIINQTEASAHAVLGLHALQHRGQEACGIVSLAQRGQFHGYRALGEVAETFSDPEIVASLKGDAAIGHNRYATTGATILRNVQPLHADLASGGFAVAHNGNLTNAQSLREQLVQRGSLFQTTSDTEVIVHLMALARGGGTVDRLVEALRQVEGAYSLVALSETEMVGVRDPLGVRPLVLGILEGADGEEAPILASETCALDILGATYVRDLEPGEMLVLRRDGSQESIRPFRKAAGRFCVFEYIYFARPDSWIEGMSVYEARKAIGRELAREFRVEADLVVPVPDSGVPAALGFAEACSLPFELGIIRNHYVGRTFIEPTASIRHLGVKLKHNANRGLLDGKRVVLVDDSIVRGTTSRKIVEMVRQAGAVEVHMRISSPPTKHPCFYGIDTPEQDQLLAHRYSVEEMRDQIGVDSLSFISMDGLYRAMGRAARDEAAPEYCDACFSGDYPTELRDRGLTSDRPSSSLLEMPG